MLPKRRTITNQSFLCNLKFTLDGQPKTLCQRKNSLLAKNNFRRSQKERKKLGIFLKLPQRGKETRKNLGYAADYFSNLFHLGHCIVVSHSSPKCACFCQMPTHKHTHARTRISKLKVCGDISTQINPAKKAVLV